MQGDSIYTKFKSMISKSIYYLWICSDVIKFKHKHEKDKGKKKDKRVFTSQERGRRILRGNIFAA